MRIRNFMPVVGPLPGSRWLERRSRARLRKRHLVTVAVCCLLGAFPMHSGVPDQPNSIVNLYDALGYGRLGTTLDWGYSALVHYNGKTILFDAGNNTDIFEHNVKALGVDLTKVDIAVLSHYHADHFSGFDYLLRVSPKVKIYLPDEPELGSPVEFKFSNESKEDLKGIAPEQMYFGGTKDSLVYRASGSFPHSNHEFVKSNREIAPGVFLIATHARMMGYFDAYPPNSKDHPRLEELAELSLALKTEQGVVIVTGCAHTGVEEIVRITKQYVGPNIDLVVGGYHLLPYDQKYILNLARTMKSELHVRRVAPAHCTGNLAFKIFRQEFGENYVYAGLESIVPFSH